MTKQDIIKILKDLQESYIERIEKGDWSMASDIHDEIIRWLREVKEYKL